MIFHARSLADIIVKAGGYLSVYRHARKILKETLAAPDRWTYQDVAIAPPEADEFDVLSLYRQTNGGEAAVTRKRRDDLLRAAAS